MAIYTYADFEQAAKNAGLYDQFSKADLTLAQQNPDAGMSILKYKQDYANATTDQQRVTANSGAEAVRSSWGGYTGGGDGGSFHLDPMSPNDYAASSAPSYSSRYDAQYQDLLNQIINREQFSYNPETDPLYSAYRKQYAREGQRATEDTMAAAASMTGGLPSSYAVTAAGQQANYYASQMTDKIPELYQLAYNKYISDHSMKLSDLNAVQSAEQADYQKYLNELNQYNTDRSFNYGQYLDEINNQTLLRQEGTAASDTEWQREYELAQLAAAYGDYSGLQKLGITPAVAVTTGGSGGGSNSSGGAEERETDPYTQAQIYKSLIDQGYSSTDAKYLAGLYTSVAQINATTPSSDYEGVKANAETFYRTGTKMDALSYIAEMANNGVITAAERNELLNNFRGR